MYRTYTQTKSKPSSSLLHGINQPTTVNVVPTHVDLAINTKFSLSHLPPRPISDDRNELRTSSSAGFLDDVRRMVNN